MQILQSFILYVAECASDSFFFAITMHLCGQFELLRIRFVELVGRKTNDRNHYRSILGSWIRRHYKLITLAKNIEDTFNLNILIRLLITTVVTAVSGIYISQTLPFYISFITDMIKIFYSLLKYRIKFFHIVDLQKFD